MDLLGSSWGLWCLSFPHLRGLRWEGGMGKMLQPRCQSVQLWFPAGKWAFSGLEGIKKEGRDQEQQQQDDG